MSENPNAPTSEPAHNPISEPQPQVVGHPASDKKPTGSPQKSGDAQPKPPDSNPNHQISAGDSQKKQRSENQDFVRVTRRFGTYINHIHVANDMNMDAASGSSAADVSPSGMEPNVEISRHEMFKIRQVYQQPANFQDALKVLREKRVIALTGRPHAGKRATSIALAMELGTSPTIYELSPEADLPRQITHRVESSNYIPGTFLIVDHPLRSAVQSIKPPVDQLSAQLDRKNAYFILCVQSDTPLPEGLKRIIIDPPKVSGETLFRAHLNYYQGDLNEQVDTLLEKEKRIQDILRQEQILPQQADALAERVVAAVRSSLDLDVALLGVAEDFIEEEVSKWIGETADAPEDTALRIALAVFDGWVLSDIMKAARDLKDALFPPPPPPKGEKSETVETPPEPRVSPLKKNISDTLRRAGARRVRRTYLTDYSENASIEVVELEVPSYSKALLKYLWQEVYEWQQPLLKWLMEYATRGAQEVRIRAAGAIGALASVDFLEIRRKAFIPWGNAELDDPDQRRQQYQALTNAMGVLIWDDEQTGNVMGLLDYWTQEGNLAMKWAAARAYSSVGLRYPREAVKHWRTIIENESDFNLLLTHELGLKIYSPIHQDFVQSLIEAILNLFSRAVEMPHRLRPVYEEAIASLAEWVELDEKEDANKANGLALFVLATEIRYPPENDSGELSSWPPAMLEVAHIQPRGAYHQTLAVLLRKALNHPDPEFSQAAAIALRQWIALADEQLWIFETVADLLKDILALPDIRQREVGRLWRHLTAWATAPHDKLNAAQRLLQTLDLRFH